MKCGVKRSVIAFLTLITICYMLILKLFETKSMIHAQKEKTNRAQMTPSMQSKLGYRRQESTGAIEGRINRFILKDNLTVFNNKPRNKKKKLLIPMLYSNHPLNSLLYQVWDPYTEDSGESLLNCEHLASSDENKYKRGKRFARKLNRKFYEYVNISDIWEIIRRNCNTVRRLFRFQNPKFSTASFPIAYTVTLDRTAEQSLRMLLSIYHHDNLYCLHPNAKYGIRYYNIFRRLSECIPNIILPERIFEIRLKTHNLLKAEIECFKKLLNTTNVPWRYGINLPSSAFPLRNNSYLVKYLKTKPYEVTISWQKSVENHFIARMKYRHMIKELEGGEKAYVRTTKKKGPPPDGIEFYRRGIYFISTRDFYHYLTESNLAKKFLNWTRDTKNPEDFFYSSLYKHQGVPGGKPNDPLSFSQQQIRPTTEQEDITVVPANELVASLWSSDRSNRCQGKYRGSICIFSAADLRWLLQQEHLFANSFDFRVDRVVIDCLAKNLKQPILKSMTKIDDV